MRLTNSIRRIAVLVSILLAPLTLWGQGSSDGGINSGAGKTSGGSFSVTGGVGSVAGGMAAGTSYQVAGGLAYLALSEVSLAPAAPVSPMITAGDRQVTLTWRQNIEDNFDRYYIYQSEAGVAWQRADSTQPGLPGDTSAVVTGLSNGTSYDFYITAKNTDGLESIASPTVSATPDVPAGIANAAALYFNGDYAGAQALEGGDIEAGANVDSLKISGNQMTLEAWVFPIDIDVVDQEGVLVSRADSAGDFGYTYDLRLVQTGPDVLAQFSISNGASSDARVVSSAAIPEGAWTHLAGVYDGVNITIYVNGAAAGSASASFNVGGGDSGLFVGNWWGSYSYYGLIDEIRLWGLARTAGDIQAYQNATLTGNERGLRGYWPVNSASKFITFDDSVAVDESGNKNHLLLESNEPRIVGAFFLQPVAIESELLSEDLVAMVGQLFSFEPDVRGYPAATVTLDAANTPAGMTISGNTVSWTPTLAEKGWQEFTLFADNLANGGAGDGDTATYYVWVEELALAEARHTNSNARLSVLNNGVIGGGSGWPIGTGFSFGPTGPNALYDGSVIIGRSTSQVSGSLYTSPEYHEFSQRSGPSPPPQTPPGFDTAFEVQYSDDRADDPLWITVQQTTLTKSTAPDDDYVLMRLDLQNTTVSNQTGVYVGLAMDWDVGDSGSNLAGYDANLQLSYVYDAQAGTTDPNHYGTMLLDGSLGGHDAGFPDLGSDDGLFLSMTKAPVQGTIGQAGDVSTIISAGPFSIPANSAVTAAFAILAGTDSVDLVNNALAAQSAFNRITSTVAITGVVSGVMTNSATVSGEVKSNGRALDVIFEYSTDMSFSQIIDAIPATISGFTPTRVEANLDGLTVATSYNYRVVLMDGANRAGEGPPLSFTTTAATGDVISVDVVTGDGTITFANTGVEMNFTFSGGAGDDTVEVMSFASTPDGTLPASDIPVGGKYWEFNHTGSGTFSVNLTLVFAPNTLTAADRADLTLINLVRRNSGGSGTWTAILTASAATDSSVTFNGLGGFSQFVVTLTTVDTQVPVVSNFILQPTTPQLGSDLVVNVTVTDNDAINTVDLYAAAGGNSAYTTTPMTMSTGSVYTVTVPAATISLKGVAAFIRAVDASGNETFTDTVYMGTRFAADELGTESLSGNSYSSGFPKDKWRLISVPAILDNMSLAGNFEELGSVDNTVWRLYAYRNGNLTENPGSLGAGESFWLYQRVEDALHLSVTSGVTGGEGHIARSIAPGWSLIGSPFAFSIAVNAPAADFYGPITYNGTQWSGASASMVPWQGYAIYNRTSAQQTLTYSIPPFSKSTPAKDALAAVTGWELRLSAQGQNYGDSNTMIGRHPEATEGLDRFDNPEPPYVENYVYLAMDRSDWANGLPLLTSDIRSFNETDGDWEVALYTKGEKGPITITAELAGEMPGDLQVRMVDLQDREIYDLTYGLGPLAIRDYNDRFPYRFKVLAGSAAYVDQAAADVLAQLPEAFGLANNYPNPFNPTTRIPYALTHPARVSLKIYNLLGQEVASLVNGWEDMGQHEVQWNGLNNTGQMVASGLYFAVYSAEGKIYTRKMILMR